MNNEYFESQHPVEQSDPVPNDNVDTPDVKSPRHMSAKEENDFVAHTNHLYEVQNDINSTEIDNACLISSNYNSQTLPNHKAHEKLQTQPKELKDSTLRENSNTLFYIFNIFRFKKKT